MAQGPINPTHSSVTVVIFPFFNRQFSPQKMDVSTDWKYGISSRVFYTSCSAWVIRSFDSSQSWVWVHMPDAWMHGRARGGSTESRKCFARSEKRRGKGLRVLTPRRCSARAPQMLQRLLCRRRLLGRRRRPFSFLFSLQCTAHV
jgi:hypothetical protein